MVELVKWMNYRKEYLVRTVEMTVWTNEGEMREAGGGRGEK